MCPSSYTLSQILNMLDYISLSRLSNFKVRVKGKITKLNLGPKGTIFLWSATWVKVNFRLNLWFWFIGLRSQWAYLIISVRNKPVRRTDWLENLPDKSTLEQIVKMIVQFENHSSVWLVSKLISNTGLITDDKWLIICLWTLFRWSTWKQHPSTLTTPTTLPPGFIFMSSFALTYQSEMQKVSIMHLAFNLIEFLLNYTHLTSMYPYKSNISEKSKARQLKVDLA